MATLSEFLAAHPYLATELVGLPVWLVLFVVLGGHRTTMLAAGLVLVPFAPLALLHEGTYLQPARLFDAAIGLEDLLFLFLSGSFAWATGRLACRLPDVRAASVRRTLLRLVLLTVAGGVLLSVALVLIGDVFAASMAALIGLIAILLKARPRRIRAAVSAACGYTAYHLANLSIGMWLWPQFSKAWDETGIWAGPELALPLGEILFSPLFAAAHVLALSWMLERADKPQYPLPEVQNPTRSALHRQGKHSASKGWTLIC